MLRNSYHLDRTASSAIIKDEERLNGRSSRIKNIFCVLKDHKNFRHLPEWRLFFSVRSFFWVSLMTTVTVYFPMWKVIRIRLHLLSESVGAAARPCFSSSCPLRGIYILGYRGFPVNHISIGWAPSPCALQISSTSPLERILRISNLFEMIQGSFCLLFVLK